MCIVLLLLWCSATCITGAYSPQLCLQSLVSAESWIELVWLTGLVALTLWTRASRYLLLLVSLSSSFRGKLEFPVLTAFLVVIDSLGDSLLDVALPS